MTAIKKSDKELYGIGDCEVLVEFDYEVEEGEVTDLAIAMILLQPDGQDITSLVFNLDPGFEADFQETMEDLDKLDLSGPDDDEEEFEDDPTED